MMLLPCMDLDMIRTSTFPWADKAIYHSQFRRVRDFRLDSKLRQSCENEIFNMCAYFGVSGTCAFSLFVAHCSER